MNIHHKKTSSTIIKSEREQEKPVKFKKKNNKIENKVEETRK